MELDNGLPQSGWSSSTTDDDDIDAAAYPALEFEAENGDDNASDENISVSSSEEPRPPTPVAMAARGYQLEMLEESLKENIIVAVRISVVPQFHLAPYVQAG